MLMLLPRRWLNLKINSKKNDNSYRKMMMVVTPVGRFLVFFYQ